MSINEFISAVAAVVNDHMNARLREGESSNSTFVMSHAMI